jgi:hypothetical protein
MEDVEAGKKPAVVQLLEIEFAWNGKASQAGRAPIYGTEAPGKDQLAGGGSGKTEVYRLSPLPLKFPPAMGAEDCHIFLDPPLPAQPGELRIRLSLTASPDAFRAWVARGRARGSQNPEDDLKRWSKELSGETKLPIPIEFRKQKISHHDNGKKTATYILGKASLSSTAPVDFVIAMGDLNPAGEEEYQIVLPAFTLRWERRKDYLGLKWPKEQTAPASEPIRATETAPKKSFFRRLFE